MAIIFADMCLYLLTMLIRYGIDISTMYETIYVFFSHDEDLLIMVVVWLANHFYYNGELFSCLLYSSLEAIILPPGLTGGCLWYNQTQTGACTT